MLSWHHACRTPLKGGPAMRVRELMTATPITVAPESTVVDARHLMATRRFRHLLVVEGERLLGIVTDRDIRLNLPSPATSLSVWELNYLLARLTVEQIMTKAVITGGPRRAPHARSQERRAPRSRRPAAGGDRHRDRSRAGLRGGNGARRRVTNPPFWTLPLDHALSVVEATTAGLPSAEARARLIRFGPNALTPPRRWVAVRELVRSVANPLVLILLIASAISAAFGQTASAAVIALMLVLSIGLNFAQSYRSQAAALRLRAQVGQTAMVVRDGVPRELPVNDVVPGD